MSSKDGFSLLSARVLTNETALSVSATLSAAGAAVGWAIDSTWTVRTQAVLESTGQAIVNCRISNDAIITLATADDNATSVLSTTLPTSRRPTSIGVSSTCRVTTSGGIREVTAIIATTGVITLAIKTVDATATIYPATLPAGFNTITIAANACIFNFFYPLN